MHRVFRACVALGAALAMAGCAAKRPVLYPNAQLERAGPGAAQRDIDECMALAKAGGAGNARAGEVAGNTAGGAAVGGATGAAAGAVLGSAGRGAGAGAAAGAAGGLVRGLFRSRDPDPVHRAYVETCLRERGYRPIGWK